MTAIQYFLAKHSQMFQQVLEQTPTNGRRICYVGKTVYGKDSVSEKMQLKTGKHKSLSTRGGNFKATRDWCETPASPRTSLCHLSLSGGRGVSLLVVHKIWVHLRADNILKWRKCGMWYVICSLHFWFLEFFFFHSVVFWVIIMNSSMICTLSV